MKILQYTKINKSTTSRKDSFYKNLISYYKETPKELELGNKDGDNFLLFPNALTNQENEFEKLLKTSMKYREVSMEQYISQGYVVSEINSSLKAEGVNSSRKVVNQIIKNKVEGKKWDKSTLTTLISNYFDALNFIISEKVISERNIFTLYGILTADLDDVIEPGKMYREGTVSIGEDSGMPSYIVPKRMSQLVKFINSNEMQDKIQTKAIIVHYIFENIHPYYDYNGRMGRILHLWTLINHSREQFWKLIFLSESIFAYKNKFDTTFNHILKAKKQNANIDLTYFISSLYDIFNNHTKAYIQMKKLTNSMTRPATRHLRLFIIDLLTINGADKKWYNINEFKKRYPDYSKTVYDRTLKEIKESNLFEIRLGRPIQFRLK